MDDITKAYLVHILWRAFLLAAAFGMGVTVRVLYVIYGN